MAYWGEVEIIENYTSTAENLSNCVARFYACTDTGSTWSNHSSTATCTLDTVTEQKTIASFDFRQSKKILIGEVWADIIHNSDGTKTAYAYFSWNSNHSQVGTIEADATKVLTNIPRYATATQSLSNKTINTITMKWSSDSIIDYIWYSKDNGSTWTGINVTDGTSGTYTISNLSPNTTYKIKTRVRRKDSQLTTDSSALSITTYDIAKISSASNFNLGSNAIITITNPANATATLEMKIGTTQILTKNLSSGANTIIFTDTQLDNIYKKFITSNSINISYTLTTNNNSNWTNSKNVTCTLTGNQKTGHINVNNNWKRSKKWVNVNGIWKRCVRWVNVNGTWKRCI